MSLVDDPVGRLRHERPALDPGDPLAAPRCAAPRTRVNEPRARRHMGRVVFVSVAACAAVLSGVVVFDGAKGDPHNGIGISSAEARERAIDALQGIGKLKDFEFTQSWSAREVGGDQRATGGEWTYTRVAGATSRTSWTENEFAGIERRPGLEHRAVGGKVYHSSGSTRHIDTPWLLDVRSGWTAPGSSTRATDMSTFMYEQPDFPAIIEQLEREGLVDARVTRQKVTVVTIERTARELAPVTASVPNGDPVSMFAGQFTWGPDARPDTNVTVRISVGGDGKLRGVRVSAIAPVVHPDGKGGSDPVMSKIIAEQSWKPRSAPVEAPDPASVTVVGNALKARQGADGLAGPLGTLDQLSIDELRALRRQVMHAPSAAFDGWGRKRVRPARSYPRLHAQRRAEQIAFRRAAAALMPFDRSRFAADPSCEPLWPDSRRAMDAVEARRDPDAAGWKCDLGGEVGEVVIMPEPSGITEWTPPSGGMIGFGPRGYQPR